MAMPSARAINDLMIIDFAVASFFIDSTSVIKIPRGLD
jgi:hypothetical protein